MPMKPIRTPRRPSLTIINATTRSSRAGQASNSRRHVILSQLSWFVLLTFSLPVQLFVCNLEKHHRVQFQVSAFTHSSILRPPFSRRRREDSSSSSPSIKELKEAGPNSYDGPSSSSLSSSPSNSEFSNSDFSLPFSRSQSEWIRGSWSQSPSDRNENTDRDAPPSSSPPISRPSFPAFQAFPPQPPPVTTTVTPLKIMLFIDGSWLYYSIYEREYGRDVIAQRLGRNWMSEYTIDWNQLPMVACQALLQDKRSSWSAVMPTNSAAAGGGAGRTGAMPVPTTRPIEVARVSVYSSMHRETSEDSHRYKMFSEMMKAGFDVNMMETVSRRGEKCVDIQLAVDMLYYATVPDAYDVALLLTGDRDFLPAIIRCRQKGRRIGLVSFRSGATLAFTDTPNLKDYDTIWLEDYLNDWIRKKVPEELAGVKQSRDPAVPNKRIPRELTISPSVIKKAVSQFVIASGQPRVSSRDIGSYLKKLKLNGQSILDEIKLVYGGLYQYLVLSKIYRVDTDSRMEVKAFWVSMKEGDESDQAIVEEPPEDTLSDDEIDFLDALDRRGVLDMEEDYKYTLDDQDPNREELVGGRLNGSTNVAVDLNLYTVAELKEMCRRNSLTVSGRKVDLLERLRQYHDDHSENRAAKTHLAPETRLELLVLEYLHAKGGNASSRLVGRYLAANSASKERTIKATAITNNSKLAAFKLSALVELKELYGSLLTFINQSQLFTVKKVETPNFGNEFYISISEESEKELQEAEEMLRQNS